MARKLKMRKKINDAVINFFSELYAKENKAKPYMDNLFPRCVKEEEVDRLECWFF